MDNKDDIKEIKDVSPTIIEHFIGQKKAVEVVKTALNYSWNTGKAFVSSLFVGPPGMGKTLMAGIISKELGNPEIFEILAQNITSPKELAQLLVGLPDKTVVLIDECDEMLPVIQTALYKAIENNVIYLSPQGKSPTKISINLSILLCSNNEYRLVKPLRDRIKLICRFDFYSPEELGIILRQASQKLGWQVEPQALEMIAKRGKGTPRTALKLLESSYRTAKSLNAAGILMEHVLHTFKIEGLDELGLDPTEQAYLRLLKENDGMLRVNVLASMLGIPARTLSACVEPFLVRQNLVIPSDRGRSLSNRGYQYLQETDRQQEGGTNNG